MHEESATGIPDLAGSVDREEIITDGLQKVEAVRESVKAPGQRLSVEVNRGVFEQIAGRYFSTQDIGITTDKGNPVKFLNLDRNSQPDPMVRRLLVSPEGEHCFVACVYVTKLEGIEAGTEPLS